MPGAILVAVVFFAVVSVAVGLVITFAPRMSCGPHIREFRSRYAVVVETCVEQFGRLGAAVAVFLVGVASTIFVCYLAGRLAHVLQGPIDWHVFRWFQSHQVSGWSHAWRILTNVGGLSQSRKVGLLALVVIPIAYRLRGRRWWVPMLVLAAGMVGEYYFQTLLEFTVRRGHPPTTHGSFPSGGMARIMVFYGLIVFSCLRLTRTRARRVWATGWSIVGVCAAIEAYARTYNLEHWFTDVLGGLLFGTLFLVVLCTVFDVLDDTPRSADSDSPNRVTAGSAASRSV